MKSEASECWANQVTISVLTFLSASACFLWITSLSFSSLQSSEVLASWSSLPASKYMLRFSAFLSMSKLWENLHLSPLPQLPASFGHKRATNQLTLLDRSRLFHQPCLKKAHRTDLGSAPFSMFWTGLNRSSISFCFLASASFFSFSRRFCSSSFIALTVPPDLTWCDTCWMNFWFLAPFLFFSPNVLSLKKCFERKFAENYDLIAAFKIKHEF